MSDKTHMHDSGESYGGVVPTKQPNKSGKPPEEAVEESPPTKENAGQSNSYWTLSQENGPSGLHRVREAARKNGKLRFTALLHHVTIDQLRNSYHSLKKKAAPGVDGVTWEEYGGDLEAKLADLHGRIHRGAYRAQPSRRVWIPKSDGRQRPLGIAALEDKLVQHAVGVVLTQIWEEDFLGFSYGFRPERSQHDALDALYVGITRKKVNWVLDLDVRSFFGSVDHEKLLTLVAQRVADGRVLRLIKAMLKAGSYGKGQLFPSERGTPQGGVVSPTLSNILLTPFDREMRLRGYQLTRYADDWVITCKSAAEARAAVEAAGRILKQLGVELHPQKTRIVHVREGFEFLGYKIKRGQKKLYLPASKIRSQARQGALYAYPKEKSIGRFMDRIRQRTKRKMPLKTKELIAELNPLLRGWGEYYKRAHVRALFHRLDGWIVRRIWSHRYKRWRNGGWKRLPKTTLYREHGLVNLIGLIPSLASRHNRIFVKAVCGKPACTV